MSDAYIDTDVIIRLLTGDDPRKQHDAQGLFESVEAGKLVVAAPDTVIADAIYVLTSPRLYAQSRVAAAEMLGRLVRLPNFKVSQRRVVVGALEVYAETTLDFGDAMIVASMLESGADTLYSYDHDFDGVNGVQRLEPAGR